ncbi:MAG: DUF2199 domain-containing protein [Pseudomonadota bacterium]
MWGKNSRNRKALRQLEAMMSDWECVSCGETHSGVFDLAAFAPDYWRGEKLYEPNSALRFGDDFLSEDFCIIGGENFFIRGVALVPVDGLPEPFGFGAWSSLSRQSFDQYIEGFDQGRYESSLGWFGWFSNRFLTFDDTLNQACDVSPRQDRQRPTFLFQNEQHEFGRAQRDGIPAERLLEIFEAYGHKPV